jgi:hypothetical protein
VTLEGQRAAKGRHAASTASRGSRPASAGGVRPLEVLLVCVLCALTAVMSNLPQVSGLATTVPVDVGDPLYFAWQLAWVGHQLPSRAADLWTTNAFLGAPDSLAFTDAVLGYAPLSWLADELEGGQAGALAALNIASLTASALALLGGYALARALGARIPAALVAGAGFGFAPWRLAQASHINILSTGGIAIALACLARGRGWSLRDGWRPEQMRSGWVVAGWAVACWQLTLGFAIGIPFGYAVLGLSAAAGLAWVLGGRGRAPRAARRVVVADAAGAGAFCLVAFALSRPYERVLATQPGARRTSAMAELFSPPWQAFLTAPQTSRFWGSRQTSWRQALTWPPEMTLSPGVVLLALATLGLGVSIWPWRRRLVVAAATGVAVLLALGAQGPAPVWRAYLLLYEHLPGWSALRTPGRLIIWVTLGLCLLAAGAVGKVGEWVAPRPGRRPAGGVRALPALAAVVPLGLVAYEGQGFVPHWEIRPPPIAVAALPQPVMFLPTDQIGDYAMMLWSTQGWPVIANGSSGFDPPFQARLRAAVTTFPDAASVAALRARGVRTVVLVRSRAAGTPWARAADKAVAGLPLRRVDTGDAVVYHLE